jgi:hypothetical protein
MFPVLHLTRGTLVDRLRGGATMLAHGVAEWQRVMHCHDPARAGDRGPDRRRMLIQSLRRLSDVRRVRSGCCLVRDLTAGSPP